MKTATKAAILRLGRIYPISSGVHSTLSDNELRDAFGALGSSYSDEGLNDSAVALMTKMLASGERDIGKGRSWSLDGMTNLLDSDVQGPLSTISASWIAKMAFRLFNLQYEIILNVTCPQGCALMMAEIVNKNGEALADEEFATMVDEVEAAIGAGGAPVPHFSKKELEWVSDRMRMAAGSFGAVGTGWQDDTDRIARAAILGVAFHNPHALSFHCFFTNQWVDDDPVAIRLLGKAKSSDFIVSGDGDAYNTYVNCINKAVNVHSKDSPDIGAIQIWDPAIQYGEAGQAVSSIFLNHMPAVEMSRACVYFKMSIINPVVPTNPPISLAIDPGSNVTPTSFSLPSFLKGDIDYNADFGQGAMLVDNIMIASQLDIWGHGESPESAAKAVAYTGMELFTAPQTLVNYDTPGTHKASQETLEREGIKPLDPSRPFMSLRSFKISVMPTRGAMSMQSGELMLTLHDRSRMGEISELIKPDFLGVLELFIEYGWSHPDPYTNDYGALIDAMKTGAKYTVYNSSFQFVEGGSVDITLKIITKGSSQVDFTDAAMSAGLMENWKAIKVAMGAISALRRDVLNRPGIKDVGGTQEINTLSLGTTGMLVDPVQVAKIQEWIDAYSGAGAEPAKLAGYLTTLKEMVEGSQGMLQSDFDDKITLLNTFRDPFATTVVGKNSSDVANVVSALNEDPAAPWVNVPMKPNWVSFGKVATLFMGLPLTASGLYDEVQLIFYPANDSAGWFAGGNIGAFPIDMRKNPSTGFQFKELLQEQYKEFGGQYPVIRFMQWISENFVENQMCLGYGLTWDNNDTGALNFGVDDEGNIVNRSKTTGLDATKTKNINNLKMAYYGAAGEEQNGAPTPFKPINLKIHLEVLQGDPEEAAKRMRAGATDEQIGAYASKTILRIHFVDAAASTSGILDEVLLQLRSTESGVIQPKRGKRRLCGPNQLAWKYVIDKWHTSQEEMWSQLEAVGLIRSFEGLLNPPSTAYREFTSTHKDWMQGVLDSGKLSGMEALYQAKIDQAQEKLDYWAQIDAAIAAGSTPGMPSYTLAASPRQIMNFMKTVLPYITYGSEGSVVKSCNVQSSGDSAVASMYMVRAAKGNTVGAPTRGLPMQCAPVSMSLTMLGCPLVEYMQQYFVDLHTNTSLDNRYAVTGIDHTLSPGAYETSLKLTPWDAWSSFRNNAQKLHEAGLILGGLIAPIYQNPDG